MSLRQDEQDLQDERMNQLTQRVIGAAYTVHNSLGSGFLESVYENSLRVELVKQGIASETQKPIQVFYDGQMVGDFKADMLIEGCLLVELKAVNAIVPAHEVQLVNYLTATGLDIGLLINFGSSVTVKRKYRLQKNPVHPENPVKKTSGGEA